VVADDTSPLPGRPGSGEVSRRVDGRRFVLLRVLGRAGCRAAGLSVTVTHEAAPRIHSAITDAVKPT